MKTVPSCYIIVFSPAIQNGSCIITSFSRNIFFQPPNTNSILNKNLIALDILQALITFLLNKPAVSYRCPFQEKHSSFPLAKASKYFGSRSKQYHSLLSRSSSKSIPKRNMASRNRLVLCQ